MPVSTITSKSQITLPKEVRERMGLRPGDRIEFVEENGSYVLRKHLEGNPFEKWRGYLKHLAGRTSDELVEEMRGE
jgi:antitoxin PrlF